ncbi:MAG: NADH-quinone oxidoreductase subunit H [Thermoplasmata archaeon]|nr:NADH-quinone oxidoreductase subunit H [Thermoplasmata archaeon]
MLNELLHILYLILGTILVCAFGILFGLLTKGIDRKLAAHMQWRIGPPIIQPFRDVKKLFCKENIIPRNAVAWLYNAAPLICLAATVSILLYIPLGSIPPILKGYGDVILVLYLLTIPSLALVAGGFASGSPFASVGAQREMVLMMSYEFPLATTVIALGWKISTLYPHEKAFSLATFARYPVWNIMGPFGIIGTIILLIVMLLVTTGEITKVPFDIAEAETEIAEGLLVEYSGKNLGLFYLADAVKTVVMSSLIVALFFPYNLSPYLSSCLSLPGIVWNAIDFLFFLVKIEIVVFFAMTFIRVSVARFKVDQVVKFYWGYLTLAALIALIFIAIDILLR